MSTDGLADEAKRRTGPLAGIKVVEFQSRGPGPFGAMILADLGADVVRVARLSDVAPDTGESLTERSLRGHRRIDLLTRSRRSIALDLKHPDGLAAALRLVDNADVLVEGYRPGVAERLGIGPDVCLQRNPRLVYGRMTGFGQDGPYAQRPGHDINYVAMGGALDMLRRPGEAPMPPANFVGDFGGGGMLLVVGVLSALLERSVSGQGQVVDAAMVDGVALFTAMMHGMRAEGIWSDEPGTHPLTLAAPFYNVYETADGRYLTVGAGENQFYGKLIDALGLDESLVRDQSDPTTWPAAKEELAALFRTKTLAEWDALLESVDACYSPVLTLGEATEHPHNVARNVYQTVDGVLQPAPAPRFSRTPSSVAGPPVQPGEHTREVLADWGFDDRTLDALIATGAARQA